MRLTLGLLLCLLAACAGPPDNTPQGICAAKAENDPHVKELIMLSGTNTKLLADLRPQLRDARREATIRCLADMGIETRGGVQRQTPALPQ